MNFTKKRLVLYLVFILTTISIVRLLRITVLTHSSSSSASLPPLLASQASEAHSNVEIHRISLNPTVLTEKEFKLLAYLVARQSPCNLLVFGLEPEYLSLASINHKGNTIFLENNPDKIRSTAPKISKTASIYKVKYNKPAKEAYKLLRHARENPACSNPSMTNHLSGSKCGLVLRDLPRDVYELRWDVIVIDGPSGDSMEAMGRMGAIYTAAVMARNGKLTDVVVHDVDRTVERWFSWEFLCEENLVSSKGKLWSFRIRGRLNSTEFCHSKPVVIV